MADASSHRDGKRPESVPEPESHLPETGSMPGMCTKVLDADDAQRLRVLASRVELVKAKVGNMMVSVKTTVSNKKVQVTTASAVASAAVLGTGGGAAGLLVGGAMGAATGLVPAFFTFGLSIPVFTAIGSGCGLATGTVVGGTIGLVGGGAAGYGVCTKPEAARREVGQPRS